MNRIASTSASLSLLISVAFAVVLHNTVKYDRPLRSIHGRVSSSGRVVAGLSVDIYDNAQVCLDDSLPPVEKRKRQTKIVSVEPNSKGEFNIKHLPKGFYEVEFGNRGNGGYDVLSVLVNIDPKGTKDSLCVNLGLEGQPDNSAAIKCEP